MDPVSASLFDSVEEKIILTLVKTVKKTLSRTIAIGTKTVMTGKRDQAQCQIQIRTRGDGFLAN